MSELRKVRPHELLMAAYFAITALMIAVLGLPDRGWVPLLLLHVGAVGVSLLALPQLPDRGPAGVLRNWLPFLVLPLIYKEVAVLNTLFTSGYHDAAVQRWEDAIFGSQAAITLREALPSRILSEYLHFGYFGYYAIFPTLGITLYLRGRIADYQVALTVTLGTFFVCYLVFIVFPVAGPWYHFPRPGSDVGWVFPGLIHALLERGAAKGAAFPSSHAAAAVAMWLAAWKLHRGVFRVLAFVVPALVVGTVYGGFHYAIDAATGVVTGVACYVLFVNVHRWLSGAPSVEQVRDPGAALEARDRMRIPR